MDDLGQLRAVVEALRQVAANRKSYRQGLADADRQFRSVLAEEIRNNPPSAERWMKVADRVWRPESGVPSVPEKDREALAHLNSRTTTITTKARPDEMAHGHLGRLKTINLRKSTAVVVRDLRQHFGLSGSEDGSPLVPELLARTSETALQRYVRAHTLLPFLRAVTNHHADLYHGDPADFATIRRNAMCLAQSGAVFCKDCVREDIESLGYSYWRVSHQLPGLINCAKHGSPLFRTPSKAVFDGPPSDALPAAAPLFDNIDWGANPVLARYAEIAHGFLDFEKPQEMHEAAFKLAARAKERGLRVAQNGKRSTLTDVALDSLPADWIAQFLPALKALTQNRHGGPLFNVLRTPSTPIPCAIALALLFDSADEALAYWGAQHLQQSITRKPKKEYGFEFWNGAAMLRRYRHTGGSHTEIARCLGADLTNLSEQLNAAGMPALGRVHFDSTGRALLAFFQGEALEAAAEIFGADKKSMEDIVRIVGAARLKDALRMKGKKTSKALDVL